MTFKTGKSGNPAGRPKGATNKRTRLAKLLEPHAEALVDKMVEIALAGDVMALRLCIERLIPKVQGEPLGVDFPAVLTDEGSASLKDEILRAVLDGRLCAADADRVICLISNLHPKASSLSLSNVTDPVEASRIYQSIMNGL